MHGHTGQFADQLDAIAADGRTPVMLGALAAHLVGREPLPERPVVLSFDDGFADLAGPTDEALADRSRPATAYLTTGDLKGGAGSLLPPAPRAGTAPVVARAVLRRTTNGHPGRARRPVRLGALPLGL